MSRAFRMHDHAPSADALFVLFFSTRDDRQFLRSRPGDLPQLFQARMEGMVRVAIDVEW